MKSNTFNIGATTFALLAALFLTACGTPNIGTPGARAPSAASGDAESGASGVDSLLQYTAPGATGVMSPVRNEDRVANAQTAPVWQLILTPGSVADSDPVTKELAALINSTEALDEKLKLLDRMETRVDKLVADNGGRFPNLKVAGMFVVNIMSNGESVQKLDAETVRAAGEGLRAAVEAAITAVE